MRYLLLSLTLIGCMMHQSAGAQQEQDRLDLPGDNLNLYAVLKLFQSSETLEGFERALNDQSNNINNLDLNGNNETDYIQVTDNVEGNIHNIILKVAMSRDEYQDVAVIVVEKDKDGQAKIQVIGDEDLYGKDYIVEPNYSSGNNASSETPNPGYSGNANAASARADNNPLTVQYTTTYQVATWPIVLFMFRPVYIGWSSPWYWGYYPPYWRPWQPFYWHQYYTYHYYWDYYYFGHYRRWHYYRFPGWRNRYYGSGGFRRRAPIYQTRLQRGDYRTTYSRPDLAREGSALFKRDHPKAPSVNNKLPAFDNGGRPVITRPAVTRPTRPGTTNPGTTRPVTRPTNPTTRPVTRPGNPGDGSRPVTRPAPNPGSGTRPTTRPAPRPTQPTTRPATRPSTQPAHRPTTRPAGPTTRPVTRPAQRQGS